MLSRLATLILTLLLTSCVQVSQFGAIGAMNLSWLAPTERENGERLFEYDLYGYLVSYENTSNSQVGTQEITVMANNTSTTLSGLESGVYEVKVAAIDVNGLYSQFSEPVIITVP